MFEQHVGAMFLALLLIRGIPAVFRDCQVDEVSFQTQHLGWETDDLLVGCSTEQYGQRRLAIQVKRSFTVAQSSSDCVQAFQRFWKDFNTTELFDPDHDVLALATLPASKTLMGGLGGLLACARNSSDAEDFRHRLATPGFISTKARDHAKVIKSILDEIDSSIPITDSDFWLFLKSLHLLIYDFTTSTAQQEAWVRNALAQAATGADAVKAAENTWHELISIAADSASGARTLKRSDLPESMRSRHSAIESPRSVLQILREHSDVTLQGIRSTIAGTVTLPRNGLLTQTNEALAETQVVVLTGLPGSGKSALAKAMVQSQANDYVCLSFRAEEFANSHIDAVLPSQVTGHQLETMLAAQERVLIHVESLERLLEHPTRDALSDLFGMAERCHNVRLLLTCRDYSLDTAIMSFIGQGTLAYNVIELSPLGDAELDEVVHSLPNLANALSNVRLKELLRIPYFLDMAARTDWTPGQGVPSDVRTFRRRCWSQVVRRDDLTAAGLPGRRELALVEVAVRRARELRPAVLSEGIDAEALEALHKDGIISKDAHGLVAPSHDVIEDWAVIHWVGSLAATWEWKASHLAESIGGRPALRRGFREWLKEALENDADKADQLVLAVCNDSSLPQHFRDDALTSMLLSPSARSFLQRQGEQLLADDASLLVRLIHLTRVACKGIPRWLNDPSTPPSILLEPEGEAWPAVLEAVADNVDSLLPVHIGAIVGLLEDWSLGANWKSSLPDGAVAAGKIAFSVLEGLGDYWNDDLRKRVLKVIARVPRANGEGFDELIKRALDRATRRDSLSRDFAEVLLYGIEGVPACRDFPEQMAQLTLSWCCLTDSDLERMAGHYGGLPGIEPEFGLPGFLSLDFFPASAIRGPFLTLLRHHPEVGVQLVLDLVNHAGRWYGERKWPAASLEPTKPIRISVPGNGDVEQWANSRLWESYRGTHVNPHVIECALMALEAWLLELCEGTAEIEAWLLKILLDSNSVMTTAVVGSVCNAYPKRVGEVALALLTSLEAIDMDRTRIVREPPAFVRMALPGRDPVQQLFYDERKRSSALGHRSHHLEDLARKLQLGGKAKQTWQIIDDHHTKIPGEAERTDEDRAWLLALHRMDIRNYEPEASMPSSKEGDPGNETEQSGTISFKSKGITADLQGFIETGAEERKQFFLDAELLNWGLQQWEQRSDKWDSDARQAALQQAKESQRVGTPATFSGLADSGPGLVAALCVRDHWEELSADDRQWCLETLIAEVENDCDTEEYIRQVANDPMRADRHSAYVLPKLLSNDPGNMALLKAIAKAITHACDQVALWAAEGSGEYLGSEHEDLIMRCIGALAMQASLLNRLNKHRTPSNSQSIESQSAYSSAVQQVRDQVRDAFVAGAINVETELKELDLTSWTGMDASVSILAMLGKAPNTSLCRDFFVRAAQALVASWMTHHEERNSGRDFIRENVVMTRLAAVALALPPDAATYCCGPFLDAVEDHPSEVATFVDLLIAQEDCSSSDKSSFWHVWQAFADRVLDTRWVSSSGSDYSAGSDLVDKLLFRVGWKEGIRRWHRLDGHEHRVDGFTTNLPVATPVLAAYASYLYTIGEGTLPRAFVVVANQIETGDPNELLGDGNTVFCLESLLRRYVYGQPLLLRTEPNLRKAVLAILDHLVDAGSSAAYRMRDDFVTPLSSSQGSG